MFLMGLVAFSLLLVGCEAKITKDGGQVIGDNKTEQTEKDKQDSIQAKEDEIGNVKNPIEELESITEKVTISRVIDGDTIEVTTEDGKTETVRLLLIDTPESVRPDKPAQRFGEKASRYLSNFTDMSALLERGNPDKDKYDRTLGHVWIENGVNHANVGELMVMDGYARVAYAKESDKYYDEFKQAEQEAKDKGLNIWSIEGYVTDNGFNDNAR